MPFSELSREEMIKRDAIAILDKSQLPIRHRRFQLKDNKSEPWLKNSKAILSMFRKKDSSIALIGPRGTGKTQMAAQAAKSFAMRGKNSLYCTALEVFMSVKATYNNEAGTDEKTALSRFSRPDLLIIDEVQVRKIDSDWENNILTYLFDTRYGRCVSTILISNLDNDGFKSCVGASIYDRLREDGGVLPCDWEGMR